MLKSRSIEFHSTVKSLQKQSKELIFKINS
ncbi:hypothetical protein C9E89_001225 [Acinetobacter sichuanensis]|uniref:Syntaxin-5 N-terminal Sly1p-binding domain-containing protein n=1 Tax=Acinetobacter sichuanensis TaxID=2136183 RepID=A0A371YVS2_9GAMM|nr:hypothetical protein C9E89_001225 [Acinetobacter sichuanensis]